MKKIIIGIPAYNEQDHIGSVVLRARQYGDVIVSDDGSTDNTVQIAEWAGATVYRNTHQGYGNAIRDLFRVATYLDADILVTLDADGQHNPDEIPKLIEAIEYTGCDIAIGSREINPQNIPRYRRAGLRFLADVTGVLSRNKLKDTESGYRAYNRHAIKELELEERGMAVSAEIIRCAANKGLPIKPVPVEAIYTKDGSTLNPVRHGVGVLRRILAFISEDRPLLFFSLLGIPILLLGLGLGGWAAWAMWVDKQALMTGTAIMSVMFVNIGTLFLFTGVILNVLTRRIRKGVKDNAGQA